MGNTKENNGSGDGVMLIGKTIRDDKNNSTALIISKELDIENSKVSISLLDDFSGNRHLLVSKYYNELVMD
jgi:hypothetical protein